MRMYDIIETKRNGHALSDEQIELFVDAYANGRVPDYQAAALAMAIYFQGMDAHETACLTMAMANSGEMLDLSPIKGIKVDKHSTGGVGDKTTLVVAPLVASLGVPVAKMSGRGLGHTGGTIDKLEAIPGFDTEIAGERFFEIVNTVGCAVVGQTGNLVPADKRLYALRDVTATIDSVPLIASSIMSKKIAAGADAILLDVKCGSGAFMKTVDDAIALARAMVDIGEEVGRKTVALITDMDRPLGTHIGNALEVREACEVLKGRGARDLTEVCVELAANMAHLADYAELGACRAMVRNNIASGTGFAKLEQMVEAQGGDPRCLSDYSLLPTAKYQHEVKSPRDGRVFSMDTERCGIASVALGAGRARKEDPIDYAAGIVLERKTGDRVVRGERLAMLYADDESLFHEAERLLLGAYVFDDVRPPEVPHFLARVSADGVERY